MVAKRVLTTGSDLRCGHAGKLTATGESRLRIDGKPVMTLDMLAGATGDGSCASQVKCTRVSVVAPGQSSRLRVDGAPLAVEGVSASTDAAGVVSVGPLGVGHDRFRTE